MTMTYTSRGARLLQQVCEESRIRQTEGSMSYSLVGTAHFVSRKAAERYYRPYGIDRDAVWEKIGAGEITIGPPTVTLKPGERLVIIDDGTRYAVETN
jgi:hypothetical protein